MKDCLLHVLKFKNGKQSKVYSTSFHSSQCFISTCTWLCTHRIFMQTKPPLPHFREHS